MSYSDPQKHREYQRAYWRKKNKGTEQPVSNNSFDQYTYKSVSRSWRQTVTVREPYELDTISSPLIVDLLAGKTLLVDFEQPLGSKENPFRTLYTYFQARGYRLRSYTTIEEGVRKLLMWCEPLISRKKAS
jgi:hypothetical protein